MSIILNTKYYTQYTKNTMLFTIHSSGLAPAWSGLEDGQGLWFHGVFRLIGGPQEREREQREIPGLDYRVDTSSEGDGSQRR